MGIRELIKNSRNNLTFDGMKALFRFSFALLIIFTFSFCNSISDKNPSEEFDEFASEMNQADETRYELLTLFDAKLDSNKLETIAWVFTEGELIHEFFPNKIHRYIDDNCLIFFTKHITNINSEHPSDSLKAQFITQARDAGIYNLTIFPLKGDQVASVFFLNDFLIEKPEEVVVVLTELNGEFFAHIFAESCGNAGCGIYEVDTYYMKDEWQGVSNYEEFMEVYRKGR